MALLQNSGRYKASPKEWGLNPRDNGVLEFAINFAIREAFDDQSGQWIDWNEYGLDKIGYLYLTKQDGSVNEFAIKTLKECFGWDGVDVIALQNTDWSQKIVQLTVDFEEYKGENKLKIKFINPEDWTGVAIQAPDSNTLRTIASKYGSKLRALGGGSAQQKPVAPTQRPVAPTMATPARTAPTAKVQPGRTPPPRVQPGAARTATPPPPADDLTPPPSVAEECAKPSKDRAWEILLQTCRNDQNDATAHWPQLLKDAAPGKPVNAFTDVDWAKACELAAIPF